MILARVEAPVPFDVARGDVVLLRGPNGSGKTSTLRALAGLSTAGARARPSARAGLAPQDARDALVGLTVSGEFRLRSRETPEGFRTLASRASAELSSGEARRIALEAAEGAPLLLLDEPSEGLDASGRARLLALIDRARASGAVVLADHGRAFEAVATRVVDLAPAHPEAWPALPAAAGALLVHATPTLLRGRALPGLALGPGFHALRGANGAGKSTLLLRLAGLLDARGVEIGGRAPSPGANVRLLLPHARDLLTRGSVAEECAPHALVPDALRARHPLALSGGEQQRVALAKVLGAPATLYLLDEPEAHLDAAGRALLVESVAALVKGGACVVAATHDDALAALAHTTVEVGA